MSQLQQRLDQLEQWLGDQCRPTALDGLGNADEVERLFGLELRMLLRRGPEEGLTPATLLEGAAKAAAGGSLRVSAVAGLRRFLDRQTDLLEKTDAWEGAPWWEPLPPPDELEVLEEELRLALSLPPTNELDVAFGADGPRWWLADPLLDPAWVAALATELDSATGRAALTLEQGAVGADGRASTARSDRVTYLDGLEPQLLEAAPHAAVLIQTALQELAEVLGRAGSANGVLAPERAMLACYPAPSSGYQAHLDNPGGGNDNGRARTLVLYLNPADALCSGGELALWPAGGSTAESPTAIVEPRPGRAALFDSRKVPHQVRALRPGPARWALTLWLNDGLPPQPLAPPLPELDLTDLLLPIESPPLPAQRVLFHRFDGVDPRGELTVARVPSREPRLGVVSTVYRGGRALIDWCEHHLSLGAAHLVLIFDQLEQESEFSLAEELQRRWPAELQVWSGAVLLSDGWPTIEHTPETDRLRQLATGDGSSYAVAARQTLNASTALEAARDDQLGGQPLDWLLHIDGDELLYLEDRGRGGDDLAQHLAAAEEAGWSLLRYLNHELVPCQPGSPPRFKINPRLATARLGSGGWAQLERYLQMSPTDRRPYFSSYRNGKAAVRVASARAAAGVHSWTLKQARDAAQSWLAGPSVLHCYCPTTAEFTTKYRSKATAAPPVRRPFEPSPIEVAALEAISRLESAGASESEIGAELGQLYRRLSGFELAELELLAEAGLLFAADLPTAERFARRLLDS